MRQFLFNLGVKLKAGKLSTGKIIAIGFFVIILIGALLLTLPMASRNGISCGFRPALFTATSATCVTGLVLYDTFVQWSGFGQIVILSLIQIGGMGFMAMASFVILALKRRIGIKQRMLIAQTFGVEETGGIVKKQKHMLWGCFMIEGTGAIILTLRFLQEYDFLTSLKLGVFHAVSAFCNAGFDIMGFRKEGSSLISYGTDPVVCISLGLLIILGGLGFIVWDEVFTVRRYKKFSVYTKLVLITSLLLIVGGTVIFAIMEWHNPDTLGHMSFAEKLVASFFQSVTARTAGFAGVDQGLINESSKALTIFLMLIGGSSGSTAGGIKTVTFIIIILFLCSRLRGKNSVCAFGRTIGDAQVMNALTIFGIMVTLSFFGAMLVSATSPIGFADALYETVSALATVGLTTGVTTSLSVIAQIMLIIFMYFGRVGVLTLSLGFLIGNHSEEKYHYAETKVLIG